MTVSLEQALAAHHAGLCVVPPAHDGTKRPDVNSWREFQHRRPTDTELEHWYANGRDGLGVICGQVSLGLEMLEFEGRAVDAGYLERFDALCNDLGLGDLIGRVVDGYAERTPSGGIHLLYRCDTPNPNTKLARRAPTELEVAADPHIGPQVLIETRGEGGYVVVAPSAGRVHPSGAAWEQLRGGFDTIATITDAERDALWNVARSLDDTPEPPPAPAERPPRDESDGDGPADDYNRRTTWTQLLEKHGWTRVLVKGHVTYWRRPGKEDRGFSATTNHGGHDLLYVFSTSTPFEAERGYTRFAAYAVLEHNGDQRAAGRHLYAQGYGERRERASNVTPIERPIPNEPDIEEWAPPEQPVDVELDSHHEPPPQDPDAPKPDLTLAAFLDQPDPEYDWLIPGLIERGDRVILTGPEGGGKSTLLRQMAVQCGTGVHPFTLDPIPAMRVLLLDLENSKRHTRRQLRPLAVAAGRDADLSQILVRVVPQGINLQNEMHREWLERRIVANQPDIIFTGPLYKLSDGDPTEERTAKAVITFLDAMRAKYGFALVLEAHTPHAATAGGKRPERPYGASLWLRWPEFGIYLDPNGPVRHWRGARDEREWPTLLLRGGEWPWTLATDQRQITFAAILEATRDAGRRLSLRELEATLSTPRNTIDRCIKHNQKQYDDVLRGLGEDVAG